MKIYKPLPAWIAFGVMLCLALSAAAQSPQEDDKVWEAFTTWIMTDPESVTLTAYGKKLAADGLSQEDIQAQLETIRRLYKENPLKGVEVTYDRLFSKPLTGDPEKDGFTSTPSVFMVESTQKLEPGKALDVGAGQGRNSVWLAQQGWEVTGIDIAGGGLAAASANAGKAGVRISTVKTVYQDFDFGTEKWDLIVLILSWAPMSDQEFVARMHSALRPGGVVVFEHVLHTEKQKFPPVVQAIPPNALLGYFKDFHIQYYEEGVWPGDWGGPPAELVRMIAKKAKIS